MVIDRAGGFMAEVEVAIEDLPSGAQASPIGIGEGETGGVIQIDTAADAPLEVTSLVAVVARAAGQEERFEFETTVIGGSGTLDTTFGAGGVAAEPAAWAGTANGQVVHADGRVVVAASASGSHLALTRYLADGSLDQDFGVDGVRCIQPDDLGVSLIESISVAQQAGRVVIAGQLARRGVERRRGGFRVRRRRPRGSRSLRV